MGPSMRGRFAGPPPKRGLVLVHAQGALDHRAERVRQIKYLAHKRSRASVELASIIALTGALQVIARRTWLFRPARLAKVCCRRRPLSPGRVRAEGWLVQARGLKCLGSRACSLIEGSLSVYVSL